MEGLIREVKRGGPAVGERAKKIEGRLFEIMLHLASAWHRIYFKSKKKKLTHQININASSIPKIGIRIMLLV